MKKFRVGITHHIYEYMEFEAEDEEEAIDMVEQMESKAWDTIQPGGEDWEIDDVEEVTNEETTTNSTSN